MNILITGGAGYIGSVLTEYLLNLKHNVTIIDNFLFNNSYSLASYLHNPQLEVIKADLTCNETIIKEEVEKADVVIPLAALVGAPLCEKWPNDAKRINHKIIEDIVGLLRPNQKIIYPNTNSGYGIKDGICTEEDELNPISIYGETKCAGEEAVLKHENSVVFRLATVFGPSPRMRFDLMVNNLFYMFMRDGRLTIYEPHFRRNFVHVRDVARAFVFALHPNFKGVFNLGNDDLNCTKLELAHGIENWTNWRENGKSEVEESFIFVGDGEDPDKRDYNVSSKKIMDLGFTCKYNFDNSFPQLYTLISGMSEEQFNAWRNY